MFVGLREARRGEVSVGKGTGREPLCILRAVGYVRFLDFSISEFLGFLDGELDLAMFHSTCSLLEVDE